MFFVMILATAVAITPSQSKEADKIAVAYMTKACADGNERYAIVTVEDGVLHDITNISTPVLVIPEESKLLPLYHRGAFIEYHCHTTKDAVSMFPGLSKEGGSDFGAVAYLEYLCSMEAASGAFEMPYLEHRLVHTGGNGTIVGYGLRGTFLERSRTLGRQIADASSVRGVRDGSLTASELSDLLGAPQRIFDIRASLSRLSTEINDSYSRSLIQFMKKRCPRARSEEDVNKCRRFTLKKFVKTLDACGDFTITLPGTSKPKPCNKDTR